MLARQPGQIQLKQILEVLEGPLAPVDCLKDANTCQRSGACATRDVWEDLKTAMESVLEARTLEDLANRQKSKENQNAMYYI